MPNPKSGRVVATADLPRVINTAHKCQIEFKLNSTSIIHLPLGKVSFEHDKLMDNLTTTMGLGIKFDLKPTLALTSS